MAGHGVHELGRDPRSLKVQIEEDDDVIELDQDVGAGVTKFMDSDEDASRPGNFPPGPGKGRGSSKPACRLLDDPDEQLNSSDKIPQENVEVEEEVPQTVSVVLLHSFVVTVSLSPSISHQVTIMP